MGTITLSIDDDEEEQFRKTVRQRYGNKKGSLGKAATEAFKEWRKKQEHFNTTMQLLENGVSGGKVMYEDREELHDRV